MADVVDKVDLTANLPDELLHEVFSFLSLRDKLRVESVSHRFRRCVQELMKIQPQPLELDTDTEHLNGYKIQPSQVYDDLRTLAGKSKFKSVSIRIPDSDAQNWQFFDGGRAHMNSLLSILSEVQCLDEVVSFECPYCPKEDMLKKFISQCVKLSALALHFTVSPPSVASPFWSTSPLSSDCSNLCLGPILRGKALTELDLELAFYPQSQLIKLFHEIQPDTVQKLSLLIYEMRELDFTAVVKELSTNTWSALREIKIGFSKYARIDVASFIQSLTHLPALNKCDIVSHDHFDVIMDGDDEVDPTNQFEAAAMALFDVKHAVKITLSSAEGCAFLRSDEPPADCQAMALIQRIQSKIPRIAVNFYCKPLGEYPNTLFLSLSNENCLFEEQWEGNGACDDVDCDECHRFYPAVLDHLADEAFTKYTDMHLEKYQLDKCRIDMVVEHLNAKRRGSWRSKPKAVAAELIDAGDLAMVSFEGVEDQKEVRYKISIGCGPCFSHSCIKCVDVE